mgnify:CR=1 FL=1
MNNTYRPEIIGHRREGEEDVVTRTRRWGSELEQKKNELLQQYLEENYDREATFKPRLIAEEKLNK